MGLVLCGCSQTYTASVQDNLSDVRYGIFCGTSKSFYVEYTYGLREDPFAYDGISEAKRELGVFMLYFNDVNNSAYVKIEATFDGKAQEVLLEHSPYDDAYGADIEECKIPQSLTVKILDGSYVGETVTLNNVSDQWKIDYKKALEISENHFASEFKSLKANGKKFECYLKILSKPNFEQFFWFFSYVASNGAKNHILINPQTGQILDTSRKNI